jgi:hypothetical protein
MGIVGLPNVGKSSLFNLMGDSADAAAENFPFCTIDPNETRCSVPDKRYSYLCDIWKPPSQYPPFLHLVDIAGLIKGASTGAGLGNAFLSHIQAVDGIYHVVRGFDSKDVTHVDDTVDPVRDLETITAELCLKDLAYVDASKKVRVRASAARQSQSPALYVRAQPARQPARLRVVVCCRICVDNTSPDLAACLAAVQLDCRAPTPAHAEAELRCVPAPPGARGRREEEPQVQVAAASLRRV